MDGGRVWLSRRGNWLRVFQTARARVSLFPAFAAAQRVAACSDCVSSTAASKTTTSPLSESGGGWEAQRGGAVGGGVVGSWWGAGTGRWLLWLLRLLERRGRRGGGRSLGGGWGGVGCWAAGDSLGIGCSVGCVGLGGWWWLYVG